jgi:hypothetical protein
VLGLIAADLGSSVHALERKRPRIDRTPAIEGTPLRSSALGRA